MITLKKGLVILMIKEIIKKLISLEDVVWDIYAFRHEPLIGKITSKQLHDYAYNARKCGYSLAEQIRNKYLGKSVREIVEAEGAKIHEEDIGWDGYRTVFASFVEPDNITIYTDNGTRTDALIDKEGLAKYIGDVKTTDLLLAHELFHYMETKMPDIYTMAKHVRLYKIWRYEYMSRILCLEEIGAMAFAKELTGLSCPTYVFDVLMLYDSNPKKALEQYKCIMEYEH